MLGESDPEINKSLDSISKANRNLINEQAKIFSQSIVPELKTIGIELIKVSDLQQSQKDWCKIFFKTHLFPVLTPLVVDEGHPFPFISNLSSSLGIWLQNPEVEGEVVFARVKIPSVFPSWVLIPEEANPSVYRFVSSFDIVINHLELLFPGLKSLHTTSFRVTRNAIVDREEEEQENDDLLEIVAEELKERRFAEAIRLEYPPGADPTMIALLKRELELNENDVFELPMPLENFQVAPILDLKMPQWQFSHWSPIDSPALAQSSSTIFDLIKKRDILVHHPFESFIKEASQDPKAVAIKMTIYRTGEDSPFIPYLIRAAEAGKQVACLVELQARFDEERNIQAAQALEKAGVHVVYGIKGLKTHSKLALVVRRENEEMASYVHIGTGNYHAKTSLLYTDLRFFTADRGIVGDVVNLFHHLTGKSLRWYFEKLLIAPIDMRSTFLRMIEREMAHVKAGREGHIVFKINNLEDSEIIQSLYDASRAGVKIDLIVRSICCLRAKVKGISDNIRVISIVDRFLEHSRIFYFRNGQDLAEDGEYYIGSSDLMRRNLNDRVEALTPINSPFIKKQLAEILDLYWNDSVQSWELNSDGNYIKRTSSYGQSSAQENLMALHQKIREKQKLLLVQEPN